MAGKSDADDGVSGLPEEWGHIVIPDDVSQLDTLVAEVRRELDHDARMLRRERRLPFVVMAVTVIVTLTSLLCVPLLAGAGQSRTPTPARTSVLDPSNDPSTGDDCAEPDCPVRPAPDPGR